MSQATSPSRRARDSRKYPIFHALCSYSRREQRGIGSADEATRALPNTGRIGAAIDKSIQSITILSTPGIQGQRRLFTQLVDGSRREKNRRQTLAKKAILGTIGGLKGNLGLVIPSTQPARLPEWSMRMTIWMKKSLVTACLLATVAAGGALEAADWERFRGPHALGVADGATLPETMDPRTDALWKATVPSGKSSPIIVGEKIFLTAHDDDERLVLCFDRGTGRELWRRAIAAPRTDRRNRLNDAAAPTAVSDGERVYAFFSEFGLVAYSLDGAEIWKRPLGPFQTEHGMSTSPILADGKLILVVDQFDDAYIAAFNPSDGEIVWKTPRRGYTGSYGTPTDRPTANGVEILVNGGHHMGSYSASTGELLWTLSGVSFQPKSTPTFHGDMVYFYTSAATERMASFERTAARFDANKDDLLTPDEVRAGYLRHLMTDQMDTNSDGFVTLAEWNAVTDRFKRSGGVWGLLPGAHRGELPDSAILWSHDKSLPVVPSPLVYHDVLYLIRDGGILTSFDPVTGEIFKQGRLPDAIGTYYSSPVAGDGKLYMGNEEGMLTVVRAGPQWSVLASYDFGEPVNATPALVDGRIYLRAGESLYCFGRRD